jgi:archaeal chaperonin
VEIVEKKGMVPEALSEGTQRTKGRDAQKLNIMVATTIADSLKTTLGPMGMDKMLVDSLGDIVVTNDGATILREVDVDHPVAKMMVEVARSQEAAAGDGTTTAVVLAGELLKKGGELLEVHIHPTVIARGYRMAVEKSQEILDKLAETISTKDDEVLRKIAVTAMTGKGAEKAKDYLSEIAVKAVKAVTEVQGDGKVVINQEYIKLEKKEGARIEATEFVSGVILDKERVHQSMPRRVEKAKILLLNFPLEVKEREGEGRVADPSQWMGWLEQRKEWIKEKIEQIRKAGVTALFSERNIDDLAQFLLVKAGIFAVRRVRKSDMEKLTRATGATLLANVDEIDQAHLGRAGLIEEIHVADDYMVFVRECLNPKSVSLLIRGGTKHITEEVERAIEDCLGVLRAALEDRKVVAGGGACEVELARQLRTFAKGFLGREQLAIKAFADALESIPRALAENAGLDQIDLLMQLISKNETEGAKTGLDIFDGKIKDMYAEGIIEPVRVKKQALNLASEVAIMILRIDDVIAASKIGKLPPIPPQGAVSDR